MDFFLDINEQMHSLGTKGKKKQKSFALLPLMLWPSQRSFLRCKTQTLTAVQSCVF